MYPYMNEDVMWERLKDIQREADNSRLWAVAHPMPIVGLVAWVDGLAGRLTRRTRAARRFLA